MPRDTVYRKITPQGSIKAPSNAVKKMITLVMKQSIQGNLTNKPTVSVRKAKPLPKPQKPRTKRKTAKPAKLLK